MVTDEMVWKAQEAGEAEIASWRVLEWHSSGAVKAVRDRMPLTYDSETMKAFDDVVHQVDFKDKKNADRYIRWQGMKAALEAVMVDTPTHTG